MTSISPPVSHLTSGYYTIPAGMPFAWCLASGIMQAFGRGYSLSTVQILLPSRRAVQSVQAAFTEVANGTPLLLPKMSPIGDIEEDESDILSLSLGGNSSPDTVADITLPNCPVCHQSVSIAARAAEAAGIPAVIMGCARDIVEHVGVSRFLLNNHQS